MLADPDHLTRMLTRLKLTAIRDQLDSLLDEAGRGEMSIRDSLALLCEREIARKDQRRIEMAMGLARFPFARDLAGFDFAAQPSVDRAQIREIATGRFIANGESVLFLGHRAWARRISRSHSAARRSPPATQCCSPRRRRWSHNLPGRTAKVGSRSG
jgi:hypothetical protein